MTDCIEAVAPTPVGDQRSPSLALCLISWWLEVALFVVAEEQSRVRVGRLE